MQLVFSCLAFLVLFVMTSCGRTDVSPIVQNKANESTVE